MVWWTCEYTVLDYIYTYIYNLVTFETEILNIFGGKRTVGRL
jgi:hypothetical protein